MSLPADLPVSPLLSSMADAMEEIRQMLLRYEAAMVEAPVTPDRRRAVQDFDLAIQLLQDLEHITGVLAAELPRDTLTRKALPLAGLRLDRSRERFAAAARNRPVTTVAAMVSTVDLFQSPAHSEEPGTDPGPRRHAP